MLAVLIALPPGHRNEFIDSQTGKVRITALPILDVKTHRNMTFELLERVNRLREFTRECHQKLKHSDFQLLLTTQDE